MSVVDDRESAQPPGEAAFVAALDHVMAAHPGIDPLAAGLLAALALGLSGDSRAFARTFTVEHALVLRALSGLEDDGCVVVTARDARTQRAYYVTAP